MDLLQPLLLGFVQGLGEFLPISSSAHLILVPRIFGWTDQGLAFDVALHWGTLLAVVSYFWSDLIQIARGFFKSIPAATRNLKTDINQKLAWLIILATIPAAIIGKLFEGQVESALRNPLLIAFTLSAMGVLLFLADKFGSKLKQLSQLSWKNALLIGLFQAAAIVPGFSRSGSTMTAGLLAGFNRQSAARFSFLMAVPITFAAGLLKLPDLQIAGNSFNLIVGFVAAAVSGFLSIKYLMQYIQNRSFAIFTWYRLIVAGIIFLTYFLTK